MTTISASSNLSPDRLSDRISIFWRLLIPIALATMLTVTVVEVWTIHSLANSEFDRVDHELQRSLDFLKTQLHPLGDTWQVDVHGELLLGNKKIAGRNDIVDAVQEATGAVATIFDGDLRVATNVTNPDGSRGVGTVLGPGAARDAVFDRGESYVGVNSILGTAYRTVYQPILDSTGREIGILFVGVPISQINALLTKMVVGAVTGIFLGLVGCGLLVSWLVRRSLRSLTDFASAMDQIAAGDLRIAVNGRHRVDQIGEMARALLILRSTAMRARELEAEAKATRARIDGQKRENDRTVLSLLGMAEQVQTQTSRTATAVLERGSVMMEFADGMIAQAEHTVLAAQRASASAGGFLANVRTVSAAAEELSASVSEITRQAAYSGEVTVRRVEAGRSARESIVDLERQTGRLLEVVGLSDDIARQANVIAVNSAAMNSGTDAMRVGERGHGFLTMVHDLHSSSVQTASSAQEITRRIAHLQAGTLQAVETVIMMEQTTEEQKAIAASMAAAVAQQDAATVDIARGVAETARLVGLTPMRIDDVMAGANALRALATKVRQNAQALSTDVEWLQRKIVGAAE